MKKIFLFTAIFFLSISVRAANTLSLGSTSGNAGSTVTVTISLSNTDSVASFHFSIPLAGRYSFVAGSCQMNGTRTNGHTLSAYVSGDSLHVQAASPHALLGSSGVLLTFQLVLGNTSGVVTTYLRNAALYAPDSTLLTNSTSSGTITIYAPRIAANTTLNFGRCPLLTQNTANLTIRNAGNRTLVISNITFSDTTLSCTRHDVTIYAGNTSTFTIRFTPTVPGPFTATATIHSNAPAGDSIITITATPYAVNELHLFNAAGQTDSIARLFIGMNNMTPIVGLQTQIILPPYFHYVPGSFRVESSRTQGHITSATVRADTLSLIAFSLANLPFLGNDSALCSFEVVLGGHGDFSIPLVNTVLADSTAANVVSDSYSGIVTVDGPDIDSSLSVFDMGSIPITSPARATYQVVNSGTLPLIITRVLFLHNDFSLLDSLPITVAPGQSSPLHLAYSQNNEGTYSSTMKIYSNDSVHTIFNVAISVTRFTPNIFTLITPDTLLRVDSALVQFSLENYTPITAVQFDFIYPHHHYILDHFATNSRSNSHYLTTARVNDSVTRVILVSLSNQPLNGTSGTLLSALLRPSDSIDFGSHNFSVSQVILSDEQGQNRLSILNGYSDIVVVPNPIDTLHIYQNICPDQHFTFFADTLSAGGTYSHLAPGYRRDTLHVLHLSILPTSATALAHTTCDSYFWHDSIYTASTTATYHTLNSVGCDSTVSLQLTIHYSTAGTDSYNLCDSLRWIDGNLYTLSNTSATHHLVNSVGCDSLITLHLTVRHSSSSSIYDTACDAYTWFGTTHTFPSDTITHHLINNSGCDSLITLHLHLKYSTNNFETYSACDSFIWNGNTYTASTIDADTLINSVGCDSLIGLQLFIHPSHDTLDIQSACDTYTWSNGITYTTSVDTAKQQLTSIYGCDSVVTLNLTIRYTTAATDFHEVCDSLRWIDGNLYTFSDTIATHLLTNAAGCDSVITLHLTVHYSSADTIIATSSNSYTWQGDTYTASGSYTWYGTTSYGCDSTITLHLTINSEGIAEADPTAMLLYPNPATNHVTLTSSLPMLSLQLYDVSGHQLQHHILNGAIKHQFSTSDLPAGTYFLVISTPNGSHVKRLTKIM